jgi:16S rRNA (guanine966-N2)-methyltransferase
MRTQIRIVAGTLRGRKLTCDVNPELRPTPQRVRESIFSILGNAIPGRPFYDVFAGTGVFGIEALSRGASSAIFVERDFKLLDAIEKTLRAFKVERTGRVVRGDAYRWAERWVPPTEPVNVFLSPPFPDLTGKADDMLAIVKEIQSRAPVGSVLTLQAEESDILAKLPERDKWDARKYGRNHVLFWVKEDPAGTPNDVLSLDAAPSEEEDTPDEESDPV